MSKPKLVSACLLGINCRYDGSNNKNEKIAKKAREGKVIPACPEQIGGLGTPRPPMAPSGGDGSEVLDGNGKVLNENGKDVTEEMIKGAKETLKIAEIFDVEEAILKAKSPSCGLGEIYLKGEGLAEGNGVTAELLKRNGVDITTEKDL